MEVLQRTLTAAVETSELAYADALAGCAWPPCAVLVANHLLLHGERCHAVSGDLCRRMQIIPRRVLAARCGACVASVHRGLSRLAADGVLIEQSGAWILNLTRCVILAESRAEPDFAPIDFGEGWEPGARPAAAVCFTPVSPVFHPVSVSPNTENECKSIPNTETEPKPVGEVKQTRNTPASRSPEAIRDAKNSLNRTAAWQSLKNDHFRTADGRKTTPPLPVLRSCFAAAVELGLVTADYDGKRAFLACVHDAAAHAKQSPVGLLLWRIASGKIWKSGEDSHAWARSILERPEQTRPSETATYAYSD